MKNIPLVIIPVGLLPKPSDKELSAAYILAEHFHTAVEFLPRGNLKSADFLIAKEIWELKSPTGSGKRNIQHTLQHASKQSKNIIFDARFSKIHINRIKHELDYQLKMIHSIKKLLLIDKAGKVLVIK